MHIQLNVILINMYEVVENFGVVVDRRHQHNMYEVIENFGVAVDRRHQHNIRRVYRLSVLST